MEQIGEVTTKKIKRQPTIKVEIPERKPDINEQKREIYKAMVEVNKLFVQDPSIFKRMQGIHQVWPEIFSRVHSHMKLMSLI